MTDTWKHSPLLVAMARLEVHKRRVRAAFMAALRANYPGLLTVYGFVVLAVLLAVPNN